MGYRYDAYPWGRWIKWGVLLLIIVIIAGNAVAVHNGLVSADQRVKSKWSQVENVMQRRADVINNLVETVKGYAKHEEKVFGDIASARSVLMNGSADVESKLEADRAISEAARSVLLLVENYPDLKASEQFANLQMEIERSENRVSIARKDFIESVEAYNLKITRFPGSIFARMTGFSEKEYFKASPDAQKAPEVKF
ncbi:LemA protein [Anaerobacterium chartisolvens]|uniref:LemA protein n=1 Tax=Anaerobacterium chartisolvens TaxID=1297424 RepID=A0A369AVZ4_9FIRM|nr:LemA family protein [Anaerobacterium chartisolvens]RCX12387.1 LemA protein [Anaerobacterium chartisolvens]